jgi:predicted N-acyltransferase
MLMAGCLVGDGKLGILPGVDPSVASDLLAEALQQFARGEAISLVTIKDFSPNVRSNLRPLVLAGYTRLDGFPSLRLDLNFSSVEDYMRQQLSRVTRKSIKRKLKKTAAAIPRIELEVRNDCSEMIDEIYPLYLNVAQRSNVAFEVFTKEYFLEASRRMPERVRYFIWRQNGKAIAFSFCMIWGDTIYDNDIGLDYAVAHELNLYHLTFHDILDWALKNHLRFYETAPFNYEVKLHLRLHPVPLDLYIRHRSPVINLLLKFVAPFFAPAKSDPALRKYFRVHNRA